MVKCWELVRAVERTERLSCNEERRALEQFPHAVREQIFVTGIDD